MRMRRSFCSSAPASTALVRLTRLALPSAAASPPLTWTLADDEHSGSERGCWAIVAPSSTPAPTAVKQHLLRAIAIASARPSTDTAPATVQHAPFLRPNGAIRILTLTNRGPAQTSAAAATASTGTGSFVDYSARYGAIRDTDQTTLLESIFATHGIQVGSLARRAFMPDPLARPDRAAAASSQHLLKKHADPADVERARRLQARIHALGPYLNVTPELLQRPLIALSNGQLTRAKILSALLPARDPALSSSVEAAAPGETPLELLILDLPFSGLDPPSRRKLAALLANVHAQRSPRILLALREGDPIPPELVSHVLWIRSRSDSDGAESVDIKALTREAYEREHQQSLDQHASSDLPPPFDLQPAHAPLDTILSLPPSPPGSPEQLQSNAAAGVGTGSHTPDSAPYVDMRNISIQYKGFHALKNIDLALRPGSRLILAGPNGSGKTTLLSLLLGDHPLSFSFPAVVPEDPSSSPGLSLFGLPRSARQNASPFLARRTGHTSPELFRAFPRQTDLERGGLSLAQAIASGFEGVFVRRPLERGGPRERRVRELVRAFADLFRTHGSHEPSSSSNPTELSEPALTALLHDTPFAALSPGSQSLALLLRACVHNPDLLILDEPFAGMDAAQIARARVFVDRVLWAPPDTGERARKAMVLISHYEQEWPASFGELLRLDEGSVVERIG